MITAFQLIFFPLKTWQRIALKQHGVLWILCLNFLPFALAGVALEALSLIYWGERRPELITTLIKVPQNLAIRYAAAQFGLLLSSVVLGALALRWITHSFQVRTSYLQCFTLLAYGFSPMILSRYADAIPVLPTWVCWIIGALVAVSILYHGVGVVLRPEQMKGFGLYLVSVLTVVLAGAVIHAFALGVLRGKLLR